MRQFVDYPKLPLLLLLLLLLLLFSGLTVSTLPFQAEDAAPSAASASGSDWELCLNWKREKDSIHFLPHFLSLSLSLSSGSFKLLNYIEAVEQIKQQQQQQPFEEVHLQSFPPRTTVHNPNSAAIITTTNPCSEVGSAQFSLPPQNLIVYSLWIFLSGSSYTHTHRHKHPANCCQCLIHCWWQSAAANFFPAMMSVGSGIITWKKEEEEEKTLAEEQLFLHFLFLLCCFCLLSFTLPLLLLLLLLLRRRWRP